MGKGDYSLFVGHRHDTCIICKKNLDGKIRCYMYYRSYCMECSRPMRQKVTEDGTGTVVLNSRVGNTASRRRQIETKEKQGEWNKDNWYDRYKDNNSGWRKDDDSDLYTRKGFHGGRWKRKRNSDKRIVMELPIYNKMLYYARAAEGEISGLGRVDVKGDEVSIVNVLIFKQECSSGGTHLDAERLSQFIVSLIQMGFKPEEWKLWWHSHNDFGTFWSSTDDGTIEDLSKESTLYSTCINKAGSIIGREDVNGEEATIPVEIGGAENVALKRQCEKEVKELVTHETYANSYNKNKYNDEWYSNLEWKEFSKKRRRKMSKRYTYDEKEETWNKNT